MEDAIVVNHTSDDHPWFQSARSSRDSPYRSWYVWAGDPEAPPDAKITDLFGSSEIAQVELQDPRLRLPPYGYRWLRAQRKGAEQAL